MTWRTGTKNPHTLYYDEGEVSIPHGFLMNPGVARRICEAMNERDELLALVAAIRNETESVNGKYSHPDLLEQAVCTAFDNIRAHLAKHST